jgi:hypothetical protein
MQDLALALRGDQSSRVCRGCDPASVTHQRVHAEDRATSTDSSPVRLDRRAEHAPAAVIAVANRGDEQAKS